jgi:hypothetical protein
MKLALFFSVFLSIAAQASNYPGDYSYKHAEAADGPVRVVRAIQPGGWQTVLDVDYMGRLVASPGLKVYVRVNYQNGAREAVFPLHAYNGRGYYRAETRITGGCLTGELGGCREHGSAEMRELLLWAQRADGTLYALDVEFAFFDDAGNWDSKDGANYRVRFGQQ